MARRSYAQTLKAMLEADVIEECPDNKGFKTPIFLVNKKDGTYRPHYWNGKNYQFKRLPFGMTSSGNTFSRELMEVLKGCNFSPDNVQVYLDDITVFATNFDDFMKNQRLLFQAVIKNGLKLKPEKCLVLKKEAIYRRKNKRPG